MNSPLILDSTPFTTDESDRNNTTLEEGRGCSLFIIFPLSDTWLNKVAEDSMRMRIPENNFCIVFLLKIANANLDILYSGRDRVIPYLFFDIPYFMGYFLAFKVLFTNGA